MGGIQFCVLHIHKYKGRLGAIGAHIDRKHISDNVNLEKTGFNESIGHGGMRLLDVLGSEIDRTKIPLLEEYSSKKDKSLPQAVADRIKQGHKVKDKVRKDAVLALGIILTGSHERMLEIQADQKLFQKWKRANYDFVCREFGQENIVRFTLHLDEKTPHIHCIVVPISPEGRLSARHYINGSEKLEALQDRYAAPMAIFGLERGIPKTLTHRVHVPTREYYREVQSLKRQVEQFVSPIKMANIFKLDSIRGTTQEAMLQLNVSLMDKEQKARHALITNKNLIRRKQKIVYEQKLKEHTDRSLDRLKREVPLIPFLTEQLGWVVKEDKSNTNKEDTILVHPKHGPIAVANQPKRDSGHWVYRYPGGGGGGTIIDLLLKENWSWEEIKNLSLGVIPTHAIENSKSPRASFIKEREEDPAMQTKLAKELIAKNLRCFY